MHRPLRLRWMVGYAALTHHPIEAQHLEPGAGQIPAFLRNKANRMGALAAFIGGIATWIVRYSFYLPYTTDANTNVVPGIEGIHFDWAMWDELIARRSEEAGVSHDGSAPGLSKRFAATRRA